MGAPRGKEGRPREEEGRPVHDQCLETSVLFVCLDCLPKDQLGSAGMAAPALSLSPACIQLPLN